MNFKKRKLTKDEIERCLTPSHCITLEDCGARNPNLRVYFRQLLLDLFEQKESFCGKRPFGNSGWEISVYEVIISALPEFGTLDEDGNVDEYDEEVLDDCVFQMINYIFKET